MREKENLETIAKHLEEKENFQELQQFLKAGCDEVVSQKDSATEWF
ncbi:MAG: hypothetical protein Q8807_04005 ['Waltheria sp.' little leaf phytoplasma]|nr:hypothetical protein ['Waltheria sp.' little leaf phytoplasma]